MMRSLRWVGNASIFDVSTYADDDGVVRSLREAPPFTNTRRVIAVSKCFEHHLDFGIVGKQSIDPFERLFIDEHLRRADSGRLKRLGRVRPHTVFILNDKR